MPALTWLDKLQEQLKIDIDCMDPKKTSLLPFQPFDQTSNQRLVYEQMISPENRELFLQTVKAGKDDGWEVILDRMSALLCAKNIGNIQGRALLQTSPSHAYDKEKVLDHARSYVHELEKVGIPKSRICIKIPSTGPALNASPILLEEGIRTLGTSLFSVAQAIAASQAGCLSISPYINFPWYHTDRKQWPDVQDPALEHPMSSRILQIQHVYQQLHEAYGKEQPLLKPASFISAREAMAMGELGCEHVTVPDDILLELSQLDLEANPPPGNESIKEIGGLASRVAHLAQFDKHAGPDWDGNLPSIDIDYLADNGAALESAISADQVTKLGLELALQDFEMYEMKSRDAILEALQSFF